MGGWQGGQEGGEICILMTDSCSVWQKPTGHRKAIVLQLNAKIIKKDKGSGSSDIKQGGGCVGDILGDSPAMHPKDELSLLSRVIT